MHEGYTQNVLIAYKLFQPFSVGMGVVTQEEYEALYEEMKKDMHTEDFCAVDYFLTVWGRKAQ